MLQPVRKQIRVRGVVQGVGFRPFVFNLAQRLRLSGYVLNSSAGVQIELEGDPAQIEIFLRELDENPPPLAQIEDISLESLDPAGYATFPDNWRRSRLMFPLAPIACAIFRLPAIAASVIPSPIAPTAARVTPSRA